MRYLTAWLAGCFEVTRKPTVKLFSHGALLQACKSFVPQFTYIRNNVAGFRIWLSVEHLPSMMETLGSMPRVVRKKVVCKHSISSAETPEGCEERGRCRQLSLSPFL